MTAAGAAIAVPSVDAPLPPAPARRWPPRDPRAGDTAPEIISRVVALVSHGCPIAAIEAAFDRDRRTVRRWVTAAGRGPSG